MELKKTLRFQNLWFVHAVCCIYKRYILWYYMTRENYEIRGVCYEST